MKLSFTTQVALSLILSTGFALATATSDSKKDADTAASQQSSAESAAAQPTVDVKDDLVVAKVNDKKIAVGDLRKAYENLPTQVQAQAPFNKFISNPQAFKALLEREISLEVVWQNSLKAGFDKREDVKRKVEECQRAMVQKSYLDDKVNKKLESGTILHDKYDELIKLMPKGKSQLMLRIILTETEEQAKKAADTLGKNADAEKFAEVAKKMSIDDMTKGSGGSYGTWIREPDLQQALELTEVQIKTIMNAAPSTNILKPMKVGGRGYAIFRIDSKEPMKAPPFEEIKEELKGAIAPSEAPAIIQDDIKEAKIERFGLDGKPMPDPKIEAANIKATADKAAADKTPNANKPAEDKK